MVTNNEISAVASCLPKGCPACGHTEFNYRKILWPELINEWQLSAAETDYIDIQQGFHCVHCQSNLRSMTLAHALCHARRWTGTLDTWVRSDDACTVRLLEINEAGLLTKFLSQLPGYVFVAYPQVDIHALPFEAASFDFVVHSDTLEHVPNPVHALAECRRVLKPEGVLAYTIPIVVGRGSRSRYGLPPSYHGMPGADMEDYRVQTEYGADAWTQLMEAGYKNVNIFSLSYPASVAFLATI
jgi:SAM-dependent methyltransferase